MSYYWEKNRAKQYNLAVQTNKMRQSISSNQTNKTMSFNKHFLLRTLNGLLCGTLLLAACDSGEDDPAPVVAGDDSTVETPNSGPTTENPDDTDTVIVSNEIITFEDIRLGGVDQHDSIGCFFSTQTGKVYKADEVTEENGASIDITYVAIDGGLRFFETPTKVSQWDLPKIPGAVDTEVINSIKASDIDVTVEDFDNMEDDTLIKDFEIKNDSRAFENEAPAIILFQNHAGQKGIIKVKEVSGRRDGYIVFDIKMQKYPN